MRRTLLALLALVAFAGVLLALSSGPADAQTTFTVNKTGDAGDSNIADTVCDTSGKSGNQCTLRAAIQEANNTPGADTIDFDIGGKATVKTINVGSTGNGALPIITDTVTIDGYTQRRAKENTLAEGNDAVLKVQLNGANAGTDDNGLKIQASNSTIKGLVINRFSVHGVQIQGSGAQFNKVEGNFIGTNAKGTKDLGNAANGVSILFAPDNTVGGTTGGAGNFIFANGDDGVEISEFGGSGATGNSVLSNFIFSNGGTSATTNLGIDLGTSGVTNNDTDDPDTGANNLQNFPVITSAIKSSTTGFTTISGTLNSNPNQSFTVQCFMTGPGPFAAEEEDPSGHGEGQFPVAQDTTVETDADGDASFSCVTNFPLVVAGQTKVTATATRLDTSTTPATPIETSEFSLNRLVS